MYVQLESPKGILASTHNLHLNDYSWTIPVNHPYLELKCKWSGPCTSFLWLNNLWHQHDTVMIWHLHDRNHIKSTEFKTKNTTVEWIWKQRSFEKLVLEPVLQFVMFFIFLEKRREIINDFLITVLSPFVPVISAHMPAHFFFFFNSRFLILPSVVHFAAKFLHYNFVPFSWLSVQYEIEHMLWTTEMLLCYDRTQTITNGTRCWCNIKQFDKASNQNFDWKRMCTLLNKSKFIMTANSEFDILLL